MTMKFCASPAPVMNHLRPLITHLPPRFSAEVRIMAGSEPLPGAGSVMAKADFTLPSTMGLSHHSFCAGVPMRDSKLMLPSSGAMQFIDSAPKIERAASSYITAQAAIGSAMPPNSFGDCGAHSPAFFAFACTGASRASGIFSCSEKFSRSVSSGNTCSSTKARVRWRKSSISGGRVKSMPVPLEGFPCPAVSMPAASSLSHPAVSATTPPRIDD